MFLMWHTSLDYGNRLRYGGPYAVYRPTRINILIIQRFNKASIRTIFYISCTYICNLFIFDIIKKYNLKNSLKFSQSLQSYWSSQYLYISYDIDYRLFWKNITIKDFDVIKINLY